MSKHISILCASEFKKKVKKYGPHNSIKKLNREFSIEERIEQAIQESIRLHDNLIAGPLKHPGFNLREIHIIEEEMTKRDYVYLTEIGRKIVFTTRSHRAKIM